MTNQPSHIFNPKPTPLYPSYRPMYKVSLILLFLHFNSRAGKATLLKLHLFSWALKSERNLEFLKSYVAENQHKKIKFFGIDSTLNRALNLAYAEGIVEFEAGAYKITTKGKNFAQVICDSEDLFVYEKQVLKFIGQKITEKLITSLINEWKNA